ncbi:MAG: LytTR family DNA-binding domain-containing protein [Rhodospirillaceae bacterium]
MSEMTHNHGRSETEDAFRITPTLLLVYLLAVPVVLGLISGINESGSARMVSKEAYIMRYIFRGLLSWWTTILATYVVAVALRPWKPHFLLVLVFGPLINIFVNAPLSLIWQPLFEPYLAEGSQFFPLWPWRFGDPVYLKESLLALLTNEIVWVSFNVIFWRAFSVRLYGFTPPSPRQSTPAERPENETALNLPVVAASSPFMDRLPKDIGTNIIVLEAQEHYTKVQTNLGTAMVLYRFGDAVKEMARHSGMQVHRSFWVNTSAIESVDKTGRTYELTMTGGGKVPVSRSYKVKIDEMGLGDTSGPSPLK